MKRAVLKPKTAPVPSPQAAQDALDAKYGRLLLVWDGAPPYPPPWFIRLYDINEPGFVGVLYPDKSFQTQSLSWWRGRLVANGVDIAPLLPKPATPDKATATAAPEAGVAGAGTQTGRWSSQEEQRSNVPKHDVPQQRAVLKPKLKPRKISE